MMYTGMMLASVLFYGLTSAEAELFALRFTLFFSVPFGVAMWIIHCLMGVAQHV